jgi:hypothetical protein
MRETVLKNETKVKSLAYNIASHINKISPNTHVAKLEDEFALVKGLSMARFAFNSKNK